MFNDLYRNFPSYIKQWFVASLLSRLARNDFFVLFVEVF